MDSRDVLDVVIIGAGPAGLAAAIAATKAGLTYQVIEKGALVNSLLHYPTEMVFFTTPELMEIGGLPFTSPNDKPSRHGSAALLPARHRHLQARHRLRRDRRRAFGAEGGVFVVEAQDKWKKRRTARAKDHRPGDRRLRLSRTSWACPARICRTCRTTSRRRTRSIASGSSSSAARTPPRKRRSISFAPART